MKYLSFYSLITINYGANVIAMESAPKKQKMESANLEIELKFYIPTDSERASFVEWINQKPNKLKTVRQKECYLLGPNTEAKDNGKGFVDAVNTLRLRSEGDNNSITMKIRHIDPKTNKTIKREEKETDIKDARVLKDIFTTLGYKSIEFSKNRSRKLVECDAMQFEVAFDEITEGQLEGSNFVEVELKSSVHSVEEGKKAILNLLKRAGVRKIIQYDRGYFQMILNPGYVFGEEVDL